MDIVTGPLYHVPPAADTVPVIVERSTLAKHRWRGVAADGREFGFALDQPLRDGDAVHSSDGVAYIVQQAPEPVLAVALPDAEEAARLGWMIGNLHFPLMVAEGAILVPDDLAVRQMLARENIHFEAQERVFRPAGAVPHHHH